MFFNCSYFNKAQGRVQVLFPQQLLSPECMVGCMLAAKDVRNEMCDFSAIVIKFQHAERLQKVPIRASVITVRCLNVIPEYSFEQE